MRLRCGCVLLGDISGMLVAYKITNTVNDPRSARLVGADFGKSGRLIQNIRAGRKYADVVARIKQETA